jgi:hypothetical protein
MDREIGERKAAMKVLSKEDNLIFLALSWLSLVILMSSLALREATRSSEAQTLPAATNADQPFKLFRLADGSFEGVHGTFKIYKNSDGEMLWIVLLHCGSDKDAKRVYDARVRKAVEVVKQDPSADNEIGTAHMAVLNVVPNDSQDHKVLTEIVITIGSQVRVVQSYSASEALAVAKRLKTP